MDILWIAQQGALPRWFDCPVVSGIVVGATLVVALCGHTTGSHKGYPYDASSRYWAIKLLGVRHLIDLGKGAVGKLDPWHP